MSAITVRGLAEETRLGLRQLAATQGRSVEALARDWEIATLAARGRIRMTIAPEVCFASLLALPGMCLAPLAAGRAHRLGHPARNAAA